MWVLRTYIKKLEDTVQATVISGCPTRKWRVATKGSVGPPRIASLAKGPCAKHDREVRNDA